MNIKRTYLENKIIDTIFRDNRNTPHFNYKVNFEEGTITLELFTYNPLQRAQHFLHSITEQTPVLCLTQMILFLEQHSFMKENDSSYTVTWNRKENTSITNDSYYYVNSEEEALEKFFFGKDMDEYDVSVKQNPIS